MSFHPDEPRWMNRDPSSSRPVTAACSSTAGSTSRASLFPWKT
jgi:hypothetical protein